MKGCSPILANRKKQFYLVLTEANHEIAKLSSEWTGMAGLAAKTAVQQLASGPEIKELCLGTALLHSWEELQTDQQEGANLCVYSHHLSKN